MKLSTAPRHFAPKKARSLRSVGGRGKAPAVTNKCCPGNRYSQRRANNSADVKTGEIKVDFLTKVKTALGLKKDDL